MAASRYANDSIDDHRRHYSLSSTAASLLPPREVLVNRPKEFTVTQWRTARRKLRSYIVSCFRYGERDLSERATPLKMKIAARLVRFSLEKRKKKYNGASLQNFRISRPIGTRDLKSFRSAGRPDAKEEQKNGPRLTSDALISEEIAPFDSA